MIWLIDHFDSFTYNIVHALLCLKEKVEVIQPHLPLPEEAPRLVILGPGPGGPRDALLSLEMLKRWKGKVPIFGICLGHQAIAHHFGGSVVRAAFPMHGKASQIFHDGKGVFSSLPSPFSAIRYHSLVVEESTLPDSLEITARTSQGEVMGLRHKTWPIEGVQFHPDSISTEYGREIFANLT